jgi:hypothetical protein
VYDHCPLQSACRLNIRHVQQFNSQLLPRPHIPTSQAASIHSLSHTCYLELARGLSSTLHVGPPRDGGPLVIPVVLRRTIHVLLPSCLDTS